MARKRKGTNLLAIGEGMAGLIGVGLLCIYLKDPQSGRALLQLFPWLLIVCALLALIAFAFVGFTRCLRTAAEAATLLDRSTDPQSLGSSSISTRPSFPKVEFDRQRERILSLEEKLDRLDWFQFEKVIEMLYFSRGCQVERRGGAKPDGGIDIVVRNTSGPFAVQCKFWKENEVGVRAVREFIGALHDAHFSKGVIASIKGFTQAARELASRHNIELLGKSAILQMLNEARFTPQIREIKAVMESDEKYCPRCGHLMVIRTSKKDGSEFWGCSGYPRCRYTMDISKNRK